MNVLYQGNFVTVIIKAGEGNPPLIRLPDGYAFEKIHILAAKNVGYLIPYMQIAPNYKLEFPCTIQPLLN